MKKCGERLLLLFALFCFCINATFVPTSIEKMDLARFYSDTSFRS